MTEQKKMKKYCNAVKRRLNLPRDVKTRVMSDFGSSINARREAGESDDQICAELGSPKEAAALLNEQMKEYAYRKSKWRWLALAVAVLSGVMLVWTTAVNWLLTLLFSFTLSEAESVGIIGGADGPTAIFVTQSPGPDYEVWFFGAAVVAGLAGWWYLSHMKKE